MKYATILTGLACLLMSTASFATWEVKPSATVNGKVETNPQLRQSDEEDLYGTSVNLSVDVSRLTPRSQFTLRPTVRRSFFPEDDTGRLDDEDYFLPLDFRYRMQRSQIGLRASYSDLSVRTSERASVDPDEPDFDGGGDITLTDDSQERWRISPSWSFNFTPRQQVSLSAGYTDVSYDRADDPDVVTNRSEYDYTTLNASYNYRLNERNTVGISTTTSTYESEARRQQDLLIPGTTLLTPSGLLLEDVPFTEENESDTYSLSAFYTYNWSQTTSATINAGISETDFEFRSQPPVAAADLIAPFNEPFCPRGGTPPDCVTESDSSNFVGGLTINHIAERTRYTFGVNQQIRPNSNGSESKSLTGRAFVNRRLTQRLRVNAGVVFVDQESVNVSSSFDREYLRYRATLSWQLFREWSLRASYFRTEEDRSDLDAENNVFELGFSYQPKGWRF